MNHIKLKILSARRHQLLRDRQTTIYFWTGITEHSQIVDVNTIRQ